MTMKRTLIYDTYDILEECWFVQGKDTPWFNIKRIMKFRNFDHD